MNGIFLIIGGNTGNREEALETCKNLMQEGSITLLDSSSLYETASWGNTQNPPFLNQVLSIKTSLAPEALMQYCLSIEQKMGRERHEKWASRNIDIDILFYHHVVMHTEILQLPHPHIASRRFVLEPLSELIPEAIHPVRLQTISELLEHCTDPLPVKRLVKL